MIKDIILLAFWFIQALVGNNKGKQICKQNNIKQVILETITQTCLISSRRFVSV